MRVGGRGLGLLEVHGHGVGHAVQGGLEDAGCVRAEGRGDGVALADVGLVAGGAGVAEGVLVGDGVGGHGDRVFVPRRVEAADVVSAGGAIRLALDQAQAGDVAFGARGADVDDPMLGPVGARDLDVALDASLAGVRGGGVGRGGVDLAAPGDLRFPAVDGHVGVLGLVRLVEACGDGGGQIAAAGDESDVVAVGAGGLDAFAERVRVVLAPGGRAVPVRRDPLVVGGAGGAGHAQVLVRQRGRIVILDAADGDGSEFAQGRVVRGQRHGVAGRGVGRVRGLAVVALALLVGERRAVRLPGDRVQVADGFGEPVAHRVHGLVGRAGPVELVGLFYRVGQVLEARGGVFAGTLVVCLAGRGDGLREARVVGVAFGGQGGLPFLALDLAGGGALAHDLAVMQCGFAPGDLVFGPVGQADVPHWRLVVVLQGERAPVGCLPCAVLQGERGAVAQRGRRARGPGGGHVDGGVAVLRFGGQDAGSRGHAEVGMLLGRVGEGQRDGGAVGSLHAGIVGALVERGQGLSVGQGERALVVGREDGAHQRPGGGVTGVCLVLVIRAVAGCG